ncbi:helix-turn-helix domain-containing protein [Rhodococcus pyridinivorans]|uniref:helix-turn-helix domain-containing protein n=1 Tax=Rhodococcus pyridinivorans TaxID=103816 RepID=UPI002078CEB2|nr:XRE family transcriptional regulator [Rhodococcus pyridinivorans]USI93107.1 XRE family transcriptional regulator [Rhodococcus pyridinivorans]
MAALLRAHRRRAGLTLDALAERTGLTKSYLSKVERGLRTPSIAVALKIASALDADVSQLFSGNPDDTVVTIERRSQRARVDGTDGRAMYDPVATRMVGKAMQPFVVHPTVYPESDFMEHAGEEFIYVTAGAVEVTLADQVIQLDEGDSLYFDANTPHRVRSVSPERAVLIVVVHDGDARNPLHDGDSSAARQCGPTTLTSEA